MHLSLVTHKNETNNLTDQAFETPSMECFHRSYPASFLFISKKKKLIHSTVSFSEFEKSALDIAVAP